MYYYNLQHYLCVLSYSPDVQLGLFKLLTFFLFKYFHCLVLVSLKHALLRFSLSIRSDRFRLLWEAGMDLSFYLVNLMYVSIVTRWNLDLQIVKLK